MALQQIGLEAILRDENFQKGLARYQQGISQMEGSTERGATVLTRLGNVAQGALVVGIGAATAAVGAFFAAGAAGFANLNRWGEQLDQLGDRFGLSGQEASKWAAAFAHVGLSVEEGAFGLNTLTRGLQDTAELLKDPKAKPTDFANALKELGVRATDAGGKVKSFDQFMPELMAAFKKLPPGIKASNLAMQLFGARGGSRFLDFLRQGKEGLTDAEKLVKEFGLELTTDGVNAVEDFGFSMNDLNLKIQGMWTQIGQQVLPVLRRVVDYISANVLPVINRFVKEQLPGVVAGFDRFVKFIQTNVFPIIQDLQIRFGQLIAAFQKGGLSGLIDEIGRQLGQLFKGFDLAKTLGDIGGKVATAINNAWTTAIQPALAKWAPQFWDWLTGKEGAIAQVSAQFGKVADAARSWIEKNGPTTWNLVKEWAGQFWDWLTNTDNGLLVTVADNMQKLATQIQNWATAPETVVQFENIGAQLARDILDGMGKLFDQPAGGENLIVRLIRTMWNATQSLYNAIANIGASFAGGFIRGVLERFINPDVARQIAQSLEKMLTDAIGILIKPGGPIFNLALKAVNEIIANMRKLLQLLVPTLFSGLPAPTGGGGGGGGFGGGGAANGAQLQSPPVINNSRNQNSKVIQVTNNLSGDLSGLTDARVEQISEQIAQRTITAVLGVA